MPTLGDLGVARPDEEEEPTTFGYFGHEIRVNPDYTDVDLMDFMEAATQLDSEDPRSLVVIKDAIRRSVHPDDFEQFWSLGREHRQTIEDRMRVMNAVAEATTQRPTSRPSASSAGPRATQQSSGDGSYSQAMSSLEGRRDLQLITHDTAEARTGAGRLSAAS